MTTYVGEILWADNEGHWVGAKGCRFATRAEAQALLDEARDENAARDSPRVMLDARIAESHLKATHFWLEGNAHPRGMTNRQPDHPPKHTRK